MNKLLFKKCVAEFIGTFVLVFVACGVAALTGDLVATSLAFGLVIVAMAYSIGRVSGCHINPAVSVAFLFEKKMTLKEFFAYVISQILGGTIGAIALFGIIRLAAGQSLRSEHIEVGDACNYAMIPTYHDAGFIFAALFIEIILTCIFVFVILHVTDEKSEKVSGKKAGLIIGLTLTLVHLIGINFTGTSVNPARSIATAFSSLIYFGRANALGQVWIFVLAPMVGGILAALLHKYLIKDNEESSNEAKSTTNEEKVEEKEEVEEPKKDVKKADKKAKKEANE